MYTHIHTYTHTHIHTYTHTHVYTHTHIHTYTHHWAFESPQVHQLTSQAKEYATVHCWLCPRYCRAGDHEGTYRVSVIYDSPISGTVSTIVIKLRAGTFLYQGPSYFTMNRKGRCFTVIFRKHQISHNSLISGSISLNQGQNCILLPHR